jgi:hypothetical protein
MPSDAASLSPTVDILRWEPLFALDLEVDWAGVQKIGAAPLGWRGIYPVRGGRFEGPKLTGRVLPGGADWVIRRSDAATEIDVRLALATDDGAMIAMAYRGLLCFADAAGERFRRGAPVAYEESYIRTTPRFETGDTRYAWLNRIIAVANGGAPGSSPTYQVFAIL